MKSKRQRWTMEKTATVIVLRTKGLTWASIAFQLNEKYDSNHSQQFIKRKYSESVSVDVKNEFTGEQEIFIQNMFLNNYDDRKIILAFREQYNRIINKENIDTVLTLINHENMIEEEITKEKEKIIKEMKNMQKTKKNLWREDEDLLVSRCANGKEAQELAQLPQIDRTPNALKQRFYNLKKKANTKKTTPKKTSKSKKTYTARWTDEEDFDLLCNFYELSIDEACNRFNRSYGTIATRLEKLVNSTKPEHNSMLMEASLIIKARKQASEKPVKLSRKERRKARKNAKLAKRIAKMKGKMQG